MKISIIDYGMGNIQSIINCFSTLKIRADVVKDSSKLKNYSSFILPGVGAFPSAMKNLILSNLADSIKKEVLVKKKPILGICLGMQLFLEKAYENEECNGLGMIRGEVKLIKKKNLYPVPIVGWHKIKINKKNRLFQNINNNSYFYFDHSYHCMINSENYKVAKINYSEEVCASFHKKNLFGVQFHPEKSQTNGLKLISNFIKLAKRF